MSHEEENLRTFKENIILMTNGAQQLPTSFPGVGKIEEDVGRITEINNDPRYY